MSKTKRKLTDEQEAKARALYEKFSGMYPNIANPSDINNQAKWDFFTKNGYGYGEISLMQRARKQGYPFSRIGKRRRRRRGSAKSGRP